jgi:hypothetical protein
MINVVKPFTVQMDPPVIGDEPDPADTEHEGDKKRRRPVYGTADKLRFEPGAYDVPEVVANHWYTRAHLAGYEAPPPAPGTHQYGQEALLAAQGVRMMRPVSQMGQPPAALPDDVRVMQRSGEVPPDAHYFAGERQEDKPLSGSAVQPSGETRTESGEPVGYAGARPPAAPVGPPQPRGGGSRK